MTQESLTPDEERIIEAFEVALSMIGDRSVVKLHRLLCVLECRDLLRKRRRIAAHQLTGNLP